MAHRILLVDDDNQILEVLGFFLGSQGFELIEAHNGTEAIEFTKQFQPDLIVLDHMMPDLTGLEVCIKVRRNQALKQPEIIMCTAQTNAVDRVQSLLAGADDYVTKPIDMPDLISRIKALLHRPSHNLKTPVL